jgi:ATP-dependent Lon protease
LQYIINTYTREPGVRKLKELLFEIIGEINLHSLSKYNTEEMPITITKYDIDTIYLKDRKPIQPTLVHKENLAGLITGLWANSMGQGGVLPIEVSLYPCSSFLNLKLTGMQGDVMKESMAVAKTLALNLIPISILEKLENIDDTKKFGIHIHCPEGATPKDGPSAGTAITVAIISLLCDIPVLNTIALTGEISLNGNVMPIGGLESKVDGGKAAGVKHILCPSKNKKDLNKIRKRINPPEDDDFKATMIENIYQALNKVLIMPNNKTAEEYFRKI